MDNTTIDIHWSPVLNTATASIYGLTDCGKIVFFGPTSHNPIEAKEQARANAERIISCVIAMRGIINPKEFRQIVEGAGTLDGIMKMKQQQEKQLETIADLQARNESLHQQLANQAETIRRLRYPLGNDNPPFPPTEQLLREGNV